MNKTVAANAPVADVGWRMQHARKQPKATESDATALPAQIALGALELGKRLISILACATAGFGTAATGQLASPNPEVFARAEDQARAGMLGKPCTEADLGRGCYRFEGSLLRVAANGSML
jgi:hypothetical protein